MFDVMAVGSVAGIFAVEGEAAAVPDVDGVFTYHSASAEAVRFAVVFAAVFVAAFAAAPAGFFDAGADAPTVAVPAVPACAVMPAAAALRCARASNGPS